MKTQNKSLILFIFSLVLMLNITDSFAQTKEASSVNEDRDRMIRVEIKLEEMNKRFEQRFEQIDKRFEQIDKRLEQLDSRMEQLDSRMEQRFSQIDARLQWQFGILFSAMFILVGFILWDRRTYIKLFELKADELKAAIELKDSKMENIINSLRELAKTDSKIAEALKTYHLF